MIFNHHHATNYIQQQQAYLTLCCQMSNHEKLTKGRQKQYYGHDSGQDNFFINETDPSIFLQNLFDKKCLFFINHRKWKIPADRKLPRLHLPNSSICGLPARHQLLPQLPQDSFCQYHSENTTNSFFFTPKQ